MGSWRRSSAVAITVKGSVCRGAALDWRIATLRPGGRRAARTSFRHAEGLGIPAPRTTHHAPRTTAPLKPCTARPGGDVLLAGEPRKITDPQPLRGGTAPQPGQRSSLKLSGLIRAHTRRVSKQKYMHPLHPFALPGMDTAPATGQSSYPGTAPPAARPLPSSAARVQSDWPRGLESHGNRANSEAGQIRATNDTADGAGR